MDFTLFNILLIAGAIQGFIFNAITLINNKKLGKVVLFLNLTVFFLSLNNLQAWLVDNGYSSNIFFIKHMLVPWYMLIFPSFYLFLINYLKLKKYLINILKISIVLFSIQILSRVLLILHAYYYLHEKDDTLIANYTIFEEIFNAIFGFYIIYKSAYLIFRKKKMYNYISGFDNLKWIKIFLILGFVIISFWVFAIVFYIYDGNQTAYYPLRLGTSILLYWIGYQGFYRYNILKDRILLRGSINNDSSVTLISEDIESTKKFYNIALNKYTNDFNKIHNHILECQKFLDPNLSMDKLAKEMTMSTSHFSKVINSSRNQNFSDYINSFRVEQAKKLLIDNNFDKYTIVAIGLECGFNSKSTFYNAFKKLTSQTPSDYRKLN